MTQALDDDITDDEIEQILDGYITEEELARQLRRSRRTVCRWRVAGEGPPYVMVGVSYYYRIAAINEWLLAREVTPPRVA